MVMTQFAYFTLIGAGVRATFGLGPHV
jgi:hypothetical protein